METGEVAIRTTIECDSCGHIGEMETFNGNVNYRLPPGWVTIRPQAWPHRFQELAPDKKIGKREINEMVSKLVPTMHFCLTCVTDHERRYREEKERQDKVDQAVQAVIGFKVNRRQIMMGEEQTDGRQGTDLRGR